MFEDFNVTLELNHPLTDEQWDMITDVDLDNTEDIYFYTKNGKTVHFYKNAIPIKWVLEYINKLQPHYKKCIEKMLVDYKSEYKEK